MSAAVVMWMEITFNLAYLAVVWTLVGVMARRLPNVAPEDARLAKLFIAAFGLLALGDTGHVGLRVWAYALGDLGGNLDREKVRQMCSRHRHRQEPYTTPEGFWRLSFLDEGGQDGEEE